MIVLIVGYLKLFVLEKEKGVDFKETLRKPKKRDGLHDAKPLSARVAAPVSPKHTTAPRSTRKRSKRSKRQPKGTAAMRQVIPGDFCLRNL